MRLHFWIESRYIGIECKKSWNWMGFRNSLVLNFSQVPTHSNSLHLELKNYTHMLPGCSTQAIPSFFYYFSLFVCIWAHGATVLPYTLRSLLSVLFYWRTWSEFFQKVSIKGPGPSQKKMILLFHFRAATAKFGPHSAGQYF